MNKKRINGLAARLGLTSLLMLMMSAEALTFTDISGNIVTIPDDKKIERILLGEGRLIQALALLDKENPFKRIIGWQGDFKKLDPQTYAAYKEKFPEIDQITLIGDSTPESVNPEKVLTLEPDIAILGLSGHGPTRDSELVKQLEKAGIPVVFIDFRTAPLKNTVPSMRILGKALQREKEAEDFIVFYEAELKRVTDITNNIADDKKVSVFIELKAGTSEACCGTAGNGNMGDFIDLAGGHNIAKSLLPSALGQINLEKVIASDPTVYIVSGSILPQKGLAGVPFGAQTSTFDAREGLQSVVKRMGIAELSAVKNGRVHGIWHNYYNSPYNILAIQNFAKWFYPDEFSALDPQDTLERLHKNFLPIAPSGTAWISLTPEA